MGGRYAILGAIAHAFQYSRMSRGTEQVLNPHSIAQVYLSVHIHHRVTAASSFVVFFCIYPLHTLRLIEDGPRRTIWGSHPVKYHGMFDTETEMYNLNNALGK